jgi:type II secretory pathway component PulJ
MINFNFAKKNKNRGFTLIEFLLYMGLFSILLVVTFQMFSSIFSVQLESEATSSVDADGKYIMQRFTYDMNRASSITTPSTQGTSSATLTIVVNSQNLTYSLNAGNLLLENTSAGTSDQLNSSDTTVSNLSFIRLDGGGKDVIQMNFTLTSVAIREAGRREVTSYSTSAGLR